MLIIADQYCTYIRAYWNMKKSLQRGDELDVCPNDVTFEVSLEINKKCTVAQWLIMG